MTLREALFGETVTVSHLGYTFTVSDMSSATWLPVLSGPGRDVFIARDLFDPDSRDKLAELLATGRFRRRDLEMTSRKAIAEVGGRPWWEVLSLLRNLWGGGELLGAVMRTGARVADTRLAELVALCYTLYVHHMDGKERFKFDAKLSAPPPWAEPEELMEWDDGADFTSTVQSLRSMPGVSIG